MSFFVLFSGKDLNNIYFALSFLETWQKKQHGNDDIDHLKYLAKDKDVIIIGGGDTGCDCIATSLRQVKKYVGIANNVFFFTHFEKINLVTKVTTDTNHTSLPTTHPSQPPGHMSK